MSEREEQDLLVYKALVNPLKRFWLKNTEQSKYWEEFKKSFPNLITTDDLISKEVKEAEELLSKFSPTSDSKDAPRLAAITNRVKSKRQTVSTVSENISGQTGIQGETKEPPRMFYPIRPLELSDQIFPKAFTTNVAASDKADDVNNQQPLDLQYNDLWKGFLDECKKLPKDKSATVQSLPYLLLKYGWCVPAITESGYMEVSLYDQSRITAALAICLYLLEKETKEATEVTEAIKIELVANKTENLAESTEKIITESIEETNAQTEVVEKQKKFLLIEGDISGIQRFIYNPTFNGQELQDGISRRLRGRSFYLNLLLKTITDYLVEELNLYNINVLWATGGHFLIIAPNTETNRKKIECLRETIQEWFWDEFQGSLNLIITVLKSGEEYLKDYSLLRAKLGQDSTEQKLQQFTIPLDIVLNEAKKDKASWVLPMQRDICQDTGADLTEKERDLSQEYQKLAEKLSKKSDNLTTEELREQEAEIEATEFASRSSQSLFFDLIGRVLVRTNTLWLYRNTKWIGKNVIRKPKNKSDVNKNLFSGKPLVIEFDKFNRHWILDNQTNGDFAGDDADLCLQIVGNEKRPIKFLSNNNNRNIVQGFDFLAHEVALKTADRPWITRLVEFSELAERSEGAKFLGVLRMDVDHLGYLFACGLPSQEKTILQVASLSRVLDMFFTGYLNVLVNKYNEEDSAVEERARLYTCYAGGDDLFIVGGWDRIVDLSNEINEEFSKYCGNNSYLHISGGISICKGKYPIGRAAENTGEILNSIAKQGDKNSLAFIGQQIPWKNWKDVKDMADIVVKGLEDKEISRGFIYNLIMLYDQYVEKTDDSGKEVLKAQAHPLLAPKFLYSLVRNVQKKEMVCKLQPMISKDYLPYLSVIASYAAMKTRS